MPQRYERAAEFLQAAKALRDSLEDGAELIDKTTGVFADPRLVHRINHVGKHFRVRGPLNVPRPPQGYPLIVQAGSYGDGKNLAAVHAVVYLDLVRSISDVQIFRADFKDRLERVCRKQGDLKVLPGILPIVAKISQRSAGKAGFSRNAGPRTGRN